MASGKTNSIKDLLVRLSVPATTLLVVAVNFLAASGQLNGRSPKAVSDLYPTILTPAPYAFVIWSLIYLGLTGFSIFQLFPNQKTDPMLRRSRIFYLAASAINIAWLFAWHFNLISLSLILMALLLTLTGFLSFSVKSAESTAFLILVRFPFSLYFGWITVAMILNFAITLAYFDIALTGPATTIAASVVIGAVTAVGSFVRFKLDSMAYPLAIAWGITAIAIEQSWNGPLVAVCAFSMMTLLFFAFWGYVKDK